MIYALDTNVVVGLLAFNKKLTTQLRYRRVADIGLSVIVVQELAFGALNSRKVANNLGDLEKLPFEHLEFTSDDARVAAEVRARLTSAGTLIGPYDMLIAGQALARGLTLVTHNTREFSRVEGLRIEDWETAGPSPNV